jgi:hypothetical protein
MGMARPTGSRWTVDMVATLRRMRAEGKSCGEIASMLGVSRNTVAGKVHRLCLPIPGTDTVAVRAPYVPSSIVARTPVKERYHCAVPSCYKTRMMPYTLCQVHSIERGRHVRMERRGGD